MVTAGWAGALSIIRHIAWGSLSPAREGKALVSGLLRTRIRVLMDVGNQKAAISPVDV